MLDSTGREFSRIIDFGRQTTIKGSKESLEVADVVRRMKLVLQNKALPDLDTDSTRKKLRDNRANGRLQIVNHIGNRGAKAAVFVGDLIARLDEQVLRWEAMAALGRIGTAAKQAAPLLRKQLIDPKANDHHIIALTLAEIDPESEATREVLRLTLSSRDDKLAASAAIAIGKLGSGAAKFVPELNKLLTRKLEPCYFAIEALAKMGAAAQPAIDSLEKIAAGDRNPKSFPLRAAAKAAIKSIKKAPYLKPLALSQVALRLVFA
ncbi:MAG: hypothetical protein V3W41_21725 [Planctomycetota bacterium]